MGLLQFCCSASTHALLAVLSEAQREAPLCNRTPTLRTDGLGIYQFALLLAMFVKPLMVSLQDSTASGRAVYRQVVIRNMVCTVGVAATYASTTAVVVVGVVLADASSAEGSKVRSFLANIFPGQNYPLFLRKRECTKSEARPDTLPTRLFDARIGK